MSHIGNYTTRGKIALNNLYLKGGSTGKNRLIFLNGRLGKISWREQPLKFLLEGNGEGGDSSPGKQPEQRHGDAELCGMLGDQRVCGWPGLEGA